MKACIPSSHRGDHRLLPFSASIIPVLTNTDVCKSATLKTMGFTSASVENPSPKPWAYQQRLIRVVSLCFFRIWRFSAVENICPNSTKGPSMSKNIVSTCRKLMPWKISLEIRSFYEGPLRPLRLLISLKIVSQLLAPGLTTSRHSRGGPWGHEQHEQCGAHVMMLRRYGKWHGFGILGLQISTVPCKGHPVLHRLLIGAGDIVFSWTNNWLSWGETHWS